MADNTHIEWTDATWNPVTGCSVVSPGCTNCYAMRLAGTRLKHHPSRAGLTAPSKAGPVWTGDVRFNPQWLDQPLRWAKPRRIFVCAHGDLFHEDVPEWVIDQVVVLMALARRHTFQVLTKRAVRMRAYFSDPALLDRLTGVAMLGFDGIMGHPGVALFMADHPDRLKLPLPNVWLGVSAENQHWLMMRATHLVETPAARRFISAEPLLQPLDVTPFVLPVHQWPNAWLNDYPWIFPHHRVDQIIVGGEHGPRPMHPDWVRAIRDTCAQGGVAFFFKQWGSWAEFEAGEPNRTVDADSVEAECILDDVGNPAFVHVDGRVWRDPDDLPEGVPARLMVKVGKKAAGRVLDGVTHDAMPEAVS